MHNNYCLPQRVVEQITRSGKIAGKEVGVSGGGRQGDKGNERKTRLISARCNLKSSLVPREIDKSREVTSALSVPTYPPPATSSASLASHPPPSRLSAP